MNQVRSTAAKGQRVRVLTRTHVERLLPMRDCIAAVERGFHALGTGAGVRFGTLGIHATDGGFHAKAAWTPGPPPRFVAKLNANFPGNPRRSGKPTIQGVLLLFDGADGTPLAVMDSGALTVLRTAAASAVAAKYLSVGASATVAIVGCGAQARAQLDAIAAVRRVHRVRAHDLDRSAAEAIADWARSSLGVDAAACAGVAEATRDAHIVVTCTTGRSPFLTPDLVRPGTFIAAVGADNEDKSEIAPALMAAAAVVCDDTAQCAKIGDLHHALAAGAMTLDAVRADLASVVADPTRGRRSAEEIVVFDSTGIALEDVAAAALVHERAEREDAGLVTHLTD